MADPRPTDLVVGYPTPVKDAQANVVSTLVLPILKVMEIVKQNVPVIRVVYDESLTYETAVGKVRADNAEDKTAQDKLYPFIAYKRSVLRHTDEGSSRRTSSMRIAGGRQETKSYVYVAVWGEVTLDMLYITRDLDDLERMEVAYCGETGISGIKDVVVDDLPPEIGPLKYYVDFQPLSDKGFSVDKNDYKQITLQAKIRGFFLTFMGSSPHIKEIQLRIRDTKQVLLGQRTITVP